MRSYQQYCGLAVALERVGERWTLLIVRELLAGPKRFSDLQVGLPGVATNLLSNRLKGMESEGLVERRVLPPPAASTVYALTALGRELEETVHALVRWGGNFMRVREREQRFQAHWLAIALQALLPDVANVDTPILVAIDLPEGVIHLSLDQQGLHLVSPDSEPDCRLKGPAELILGLAAGALDWDAAVSAGLEVTASEAHQASLWKLLPASHGADGNRD